MRNTNTHPAGAHAWPSTGVDRQTQWVMLSNSPCALSWGLPQEVWSQQLFLFCMNSTCGMVNRVHLWDSVRDLFLNQIMFFLKTWKPGVQTGESWRLGADNDPHRLRSLSCQRVSKRVAGRICPGRGRGQCSQEADVYNDPAGESHREGAGKMGECYSKE